MNPQIYVIFVLNLCLTAEFVTLQIYVYTVCQDITLISMIHALHVLGAFKVAYYVTILSLVYNVTLISIWKLEAIFVSVAKI